MVYADYEYYAGTYKGNAILETEYERYALRASAYLDWLTCHKINDITDNIRNAACAVADVLLLNENGGGVVSETVGKWTRNFVNSVSISKTDEQRLYAAARMYLDGTGLLCRWC